MLDSSRHLLPYVKKVLIFLSICYQLNLKVQKLIVRLSLISFLSLILLTGFSFNNSMNFSENKEFFYPMSKVSLVYAQSEEEEEDGEEEEEGDGDKKKNKEKNGDKANDGIENSGGSGSSGGSDGSQPPLTETPPTPAECAADSTLEGCPPAPEPPTETPPTPAECAADSTLEGCPPAPEPPTETPPTPAECAADSTLEGCPPAPEPPTETPPTPPPTETPPTETPPTPAECAADSTLEGCPPAPEPPMETPPTPAECAADSTLEGCPPRIGQMNLPPGEVTPSQDCMIPNDYEACTNPSICEDDPDELGCPSAEECEENTNIIGCAFRLLGSSDKEKDKEDEEGSIPVESIQLLLNFDQEINEGFKCNKVKIKDRSIVLCRDTGITQQQIVAQNPLNCPTQTENIPLTGTLEPQGIRLLADLDPCLIKDGSITLNIPNTKEIKLAVMYLDKTGNNHKGALINPVQIQALSNNQGLFKLDLDQIMMGKDPKTGEITTLTKINGLALYNNGKSFIQFGASNSVALTAILAQGQISGPYLPGNNIIDNPIITSDSISQNPSSLSATSPSPSHSPPSPINTTDSSSISLSLLNLNTLDQNQLIDAISSKISQLQNFDKNKISQALFDLTKSTAAKGGDVMNSLRQIGTKILQNSSDPLIGKIIGLAQTK